MNQLFKHILPSNPSFSTKNKLTTNQLFQHLLHSSVNQTKLKTIQLTESIMPSYFISEKILYNKLSNSMPRTQTNKRVHYCNSLPSHWQFNNPACKTVAVSGLLFGSSQIIGFKIHWKPKNIRRLIKYFITL